MLCRVFFSVFPALLVHQHLLADLLGLLRLFQKIHFQIVLQKSVMAWDTNLLVMAFLVWFS